MSQKVLCWDIDGTLLTTGKAGVFAIEEAIREVCDQEPIQKEDLGFRADGMTDYQIAKVVIEMHGVTPVDETVRRFLNVYENYLPERLAWRKGRVMPGVREILTYLREELPEVTSILLTGNTPRGAKAKLEHYGLSHYFEYGSFCTDGLDRSFIAQRAKEIAEEIACRELAPQEIYVIGDTPHDVKCGQHIGATTVAVASGGYSLEELEATDPSTTMSSLEKTETFLDFILSPEIRNTRRVNP